MKVILQENVEGVGHLGDVLDVKDGFARNYLLPRRKALQASPRNVKAFEHTKRVMGERAKKEKLEIEGLAKRLSAVSLTITAQVGKDDKLFGSVTVKDIAEGLAAQGLEEDPACAADQGARHLYRPGQTPSRCDRERGGPGREEARGRFATGSDVRRVRGGSSNR